MSMQFSDQDYGPGVCLFTIMADRVITSVALRVEDLTALASCNHQGADTKMLLHLTYAADDGHEKAIIRTVETDVTVRQLSTT